MFYVYENWTAGPHKAVVHRAACGHCNSGKGQAGGTAASHGKWHGPFGTLAEADKLAQGTAAVVHKYCGCIQKTRGGQESIGSVAEASSKTSPTVLGADRVLGIMGAMEDLLDRIEGRKATSEKFVERVRRLREGGLVEREHVNNMIYLKHARDDVAHPKRGAPLEGHAAIAYLSAWSGVKEWAKKVGIKTDDLP